MKKRKKKKHKVRNPVAKEMFEKTGNQAGYHHTREDDVEQGKSRKRKHKKLPLEETELDG